MKVHARLHGFGERAHREVDLPEGASADDLCDALDIPPDMVLVFRGDAPLPGDAPLREGDEVRVLRIVSGGAHP